MRHLLEYKSYFNEGDVVLIEYWYNNMITPVKIIEKVKRKYKISHNCEDSKIKNAPDEMVSSHDILDHYRVKNFLTESRYSSSKKIDELTQEWTHDICESLTDHYGKAKDYYELWDLIEEVVRKALLAESFSSFREFIGMHKPTYHQVTHRGRYVNEWWPKILYQLNTNKEYTRDEDYMGEGIMFRIIGIMNNAINKRQYESLQKKKVK